MGTGCATGVGCSVGVTDRFNRGGRVRFISGI